MHDWLEQAAARLATAVGEDPAGYVLSPEEQRALLELARVAAHESGARTNAPLACYLAGVAHGRHPELSVSELLDATAGEL